MTAALMSETAAKWIRANVWPAELRKQAGDGRSHGCVCMVMAQWCERGMHEHCRCPHAGGRVGAETWVMRANGIDHAVSLPPVGPYRRTFVPVWFVTERPCRLHELCRCDCHVDAEYKELLRQLAKKQVSDGLF